MGDSLIMTDGRSFPEIQVDSFSTASGAGGFSMRMITGGQISPDAYPVSEDQIKSIDFFPRGASAGQNIGRPANLALTDGKRFEGVTVVKYEKIPQGGMFVILPPGTPPGGTSYPVMSNTISNLQMSAAAATSFPPSAPVETAPAPSEGLAGMIPVEPAPTQIMPGIAAPPSERAPEDRMSRMMDRLEDSMEEQLEEESTQTRVQRTMKNIWNWILGTIISACIGGFVVWMSLKEARDDVSFGKALLTGVLLAIFPKILFVGCLYIPICCVNLIVGGVVWFYTAKTIIMTVLDVKPNIATSIIIFYVIMEIVIAVGITFLKAGVLISKLMMG